MGDENLNVLPVRGEGEGGGRIGDAVWTFQPTVAVYLPRSAAGLGSLNEARTPRAKRSREFEPARDGGFAFVRLKGVHRDTGRRRSSRSS